MTARTSKILIIILSVVAFALIVFNVSYAIYSNNNINDGIIQFGEQKLNISVLEDKTMSLEVSELQADTISTRKLKIENPATSSNCVLRLWLEFKVENEIDNNYLEFSVLDSTFVKGDDGKFYYNRTLNSNTSIDSLELQFKVVVSSEIIENYANKHYSVKLYVDSVQANKNAIESSWQDYPADWFENLNI